jgi:hypothetical protein
MSRKRDPSYELQLSIVRHDSGVPTAACPPVTLSRPRDLAALAQELAELARHFPEFEEGQIDLEYLSHV